MEWPDEVDVVIESLAQGGAGVAHWQGQAVFVAGALPGERVRTRLHERRDGWARGVVLARIGPPAPDRVRPPCPVFGRCGGCDWQHLAVPAQRSAKQAILAEQLRFGGRQDAPPVLETAAGQPWAYRSSARFHVQGQQIGFFAAGGRQIVALDACPLLADPLNAALALVQAALPLRGLQDVTLRFSMSMGLVHAHLDGRPTGEWRSWARNLTRHALISGVSSADKQGWRGLAGVPYLYEQFGGVELRISPTSFTQANLPLAALALEELRTRLELRPDQLLLDGFCGIGTFALPLAALVRQVVGIEEHPAAIEDARASAAAAAIQNVEFVVGRVETVLPTLTAPPDVVILDPPRRGCEPAALAALLEQRPARIAYVSCHPGTLARDVARLTAGGYQLRSSQPLDFFPQTAHVESLSILDRAAL